MDQLRLVGPVALGLMLVSLYFNTKPFYLCTTEYVTHLENQLLLLATAKNYIQLYLISDNTVLISISSLFIIS